MITTKELCDRLKIHENTVYNYVKDGMPNVYVGQKFLFNLNEVLEWLNDRKRGK